VNGGLPIGSLAILYEDSHSQFYSHFLKTFLAEGIVNSHQCFVVDSQDSFRDKDYWTKFLPNVVKIKGKAEKEKDKGKEEEKSSQPDAEEATSTESQLVDNEKLQVAWRYNNLLDGSKNAGEIENKIDNKAMGRGLSIQYKFDNSKPMAATVQNSPSHKLNKEDNLTLIQFDNECYGKDASKHPLHCLWETICEGMQQKLENEEDDRIFRLVLPDFNLFIPQLMD